ncbi:MAG TPA: serine/threonine-protein kinase [Thermomicrobiales bacterium]|nr:serine/threonine-protein kinase [Thermomicrobiales bacterium]
MLDLTPPTPPTPPPSRFLREETLAAGAYATTYRARDLVAGRVVTLTQLSAEQAADAFFLDRFAREADLLARINHRNVVRLVASGAEGGVPFVATEHVPGQDLATFIDARGAMSARDAASMARQVLAGLGAIHVAGLLHLRLSPRTILLGDDGVVRITGVGIAGLGSADDRADGDAGIEGSRYLAPEMTEGGDVCEATDLYAVGAILFEALTGQPPYPGSNPVLVRFARLQAPPPVPSRFAATAIPPVLDALVVQALAKDPGQRFANAAAMAVALTGDDAPAEVDRVIEPVTAAPVGPLLPAVETTIPASTTTTVVPGGRGFTDRPRRRRKAAAGWVWPLLLAATAISVLIGALVVSLSGGIPADELVAGVSTFEEEPTKEPNEAPTITPRPARTPTARVVRAANEQSAELVSSRADRTEGSSTATKTPRPTKTPADSE